MQICTCKHGTDPARIGAEAVPRLLLTVTGRKNRLPAMHDMIRHRPNSVAIRFESGTGRNAEKSMFTGVFGSASQWATTDIIPNQMVPSYPSPGPSTVALTW